MINTAIAIAFDRADGLLGTSAQTARMLAESNRMDRETKNMILNISASTNEIFEQIALRSRLLAEQMGNDNLRRTREIQAERRRILNS